MVAVGVRVLFCSCTPTLMIWEQMDGWKDGWMSIGVRAFIYHISSKWCAASQADRVTESSGWMTASKETSQVCMCLCVWISSLSSNSSLGKGSGD